MRKMNKRRKNTCKKQSRWCKVKLYLHRIIKKKKKRIGKILLESVYNSIRYSLIRNKNIMSHNVKIVEFIIISIFGVKKHVKNV